ncbi:glycosyltransferase family 2 protein [Lactobacillus sp. Marseille-P7033]|nr:glycosyltransferase family 2 protein [Lactobacillus sp. Marseille-P7033]NGC77343.1 glycosyltransferase family 2 protein [Limosilactobacillus reuteri]
MTDGSIAVIIAAYNAEKTIDKCIASLLNQVKVTNYQVIIVNDGSTDATLDRLNRYRFDSKINVINKNNTGASDSRNEALKQVTTDFVTFVDADDYVEKDYLYTLIKQYKDNPECELVICGYQKEQVDGAVTMIGQGKKSILNQEQAFHDIFISYNFEGYLVNKLFRVNIIKDNNLWIDKDAALSEDLLFCCEYLRYCQKISFDPKPVYHYIRYENSQLHSHQIGHPFDYKAMTILDTFAKISKIIPDNYPNVVLNVNARICWFAVSLLRSIEAAPNQKQISKGTIAFLRSIAKKYRSDFMKNDVLPPRDKIIYWVNWIFPKTFAKIWNLLGLRDHS